MSNLPLAEAGVRRVCNVCPVGNVWFTVGFIIEKDEPLLELGIR